MIRPAALPLLLAVAALLAPQAAAQETDTGLHPMAAQAAETLGAADKPFVMLVEFTVKPDQVDAFIQAAEAPRRETAKEPGNVSYALTQSVEEPTRFVLYEHWADAGALDSHLRQPYLVALLGTFDATLAGPPKLTFLTPVPLP